MKDNLVTSEVFEPYAQALMSLAKSHNLVDRFGDDIVSLLGVLKESQDLEAFLANPITNAEAKKGVIRQIVGDSLHPYLLNFLLLLVDRRRIGFVGGIFRKFQALLRELRQTVLAEVTSAVELTDAQKQAVREKVVSMMGAQQVELETRIDPSLIGGVIIKVGSQVIDASLKGQLRRIGIRLASAS
jgi:F-type H+-transporting ATPase subunit delta